MDDANFHTAIKNISDEPVPIFDQFSTHNEPSISITQASSRHIYASGLASLPSEPDFPAHLSHMPHTYTPSQSSLSEEYVEGEESQEVCNDSLEIDEEIIEQRSLDRVNNEIESKIKQ